MGWITKIVVAGILFLVAGGCANSRPRLTFCSSSGNDLYRIISSSGEKLARYDDPAEAVERAAPESAVLVMAEGYPEKTTKVSDATYALAKEKRLRLYVEYPAGLPGVKFGAAQKTIWERGVVASDAFGEALPKLRIVAVQGCHFLPVETRDPLMVIAWVAGYDTAVYGLPAQKFPMLFEAGDGKWLIATTKLSGFVSGRFAPAQDWKTIWQFILEKIDPGHPYKIEWEPVVRPAFARDEMMPADWQRRAFASSANWYKHARLLVAPARQALIRKLLSSNSENIQTPAADEEGDGTLGILEGYSSPISPDGSQLQRAPLRADCNAEAAMVLAMDGAINRDDRSKLIASNLLDYVYSPAMQGRERLDPAHPAFGLIAWGAISPAWQVANYGDDNARTILATIAAGMSLKSDRWDVPVLRALLANLRTTGKLGFRGDRIDMPGLAQQGWKVFHDGAGVNYSPHFESYLWACYLWAYRQTGEKEFLDKAASGIRMTMAVYPGKWRLGENLERARMLLCLAWLVRVQDTAEHRQWLLTVAHDLLKSQQPCGAIQEAMGGSGHYQIPQSNEAYGTGETPLIQQNGDPASDQLYTTGFALLGLHEAVATTGDESLKKGEDNLAKFLCRIQIRSAKLPYLDGTWFRAFDHKRWECFASSADAGWGAWSIESGWGQAWTGAVLGMREKGVNFWEMTKGSDIRSQLDAVRKEMAVNDGGTRNGK